MVKVNVKATFACPTRSIYQLLCQQRQRLAQNLSIILILGSGTWFFYNVERAIGGELTTFQAQDKLTLEKFSIQPRQYLLCSATPDFQAVSRYIAVGKEKIQEVSSPSSYSLDHLQNLTSSQPEKQCEQEQEIFSLAKQTKDITYQINTSEQVLPTFVPPYTAKNIKPGDELRELNLANPEPQLAIVEKDLEVSQNVTDPDLGILRLQEIKVKPSQTNSNSELGTLRLRELRVTPSQANNDPELGNLRLRELEELKQPNIAQANSQKLITGRLLAHVGYFHTNNIFSGVDPVDDSLISTGMTLWGAAALGSKTDLMAAIDGNLIRYVDESEFNYNQLRLRASIRQQLTPQMYGEIGWNNQHLFRSEDGDRFLDENSLRFAIFRRDRLTNKLRLSSGYEFRYSGADPESRSRIIHSFSIGLNYYLQQDLRVGIDYLFARSDFTQRDRLDEYHRLLGRLTYGISRDSQVSVQAGVTVGDSSETNIDFDNFFFSVTYTLELGEF